MTDEVSPAVPPWPRDVRAFTTTGTAAQGLRDLEIAPTGLRGVQWLVQVHGTRCVEARADTLATVPEADAAWTREHDLAVAVRTADCVPAVVCDRDASLVGVAHGGWRGLTGGVLENLVAALPAPPQDLIAWLGPAIGPKAYEVGEDVAAAVAALPDGARLAAACLRSGRPGKHYLDLFTLSERLLERAGVTKVLTDRLCTYSDPRFFSFRRDGTTGRMATVAWLPTAVSGWRSRRS